jgi:hypothetical protein
MVKLSSVISSSSSSDDDISTKESQLCMTSRDSDGVCAIFSHQWMSGITPRYSQNSFTIYNQKLTLIVEMNPMFVWRLIGTLKSSPERVIDNDRIRTKASFDMKINPLIFTIPHTNPYFLSLMDTFNVVFADRYNTPDKVQKLLISLSDIVRYRYT